MTNGITSYHKLRFRTKDLHEQPHSNKYPGESTVSFLYVQKHDWIHTYIHTYMYVYTYTYYRTKKINENLSFHYFKLIKKNILYTKRHILYERITFQCYEIGQKRKCHKYQNWGCTSTYQEKFLLKRT